MRQVWEAGVAAVGNMVGRLSSREYMIASLTYVATRVISSHLTAAVTIIDIAIDITNFRGVIAATDAAVSKAKILRITVGGTACLGQASNGGDNRGVVVLWCSPLACR